MLCLLRHATPRCAALCRAALQVKLVKCVVGDLVVDVSFETLGGLCTVAFLEAIDRKIGRQHLFKRSIVLVRGGAGGRAGAGERGAAVRF